MQARVAGKRGFVTGAGQGIGRAVALALAEEGARVVAASRTAAKLAALAPFHLASDEAAFMTGQVLVVDGGQTL